MRGALVCFSHRLNAVLLETKQSRIKLSGCVTIVCARDFRIIVGNVPPYAQGSRSPTELLKCIYCRYYHIDVTASKNLLNGPIMYVCFMY